MINNTNFSVFFSILWEIQVAKALSTVSKVEKIEWNQNAGPDLIVINQSGIKSFVECYVYNKSYATELFIQDLLQLIDKNLRCTHTPFAQLSLGNTPNELESLFDDIFQPFSDPQYLIKQKAIAELRYPAILHSFEDKNFFIYLKGDNAEQYTPGLLPAGGNPEEHLKVVLREVSAAKEGKNRLNEYRTNIVLANLLLSSDYQMAKSRSNDLGIPLPAKEASSSIDAVEILTCGINEVPDLEEFFNQGEISL